MKCRDDTRVVLRYPPYMKNDFIHANYVRGPPLFNDFIVTQVRYLISFSKKIVKLPCKMLANFSLINITFK